jgi:hypothetical protein
LAIHHGLAEEDWGGLAESEERFSAERKESLGQTARKLRKIAEKKRENGDRKGTEKRQKREQKCQKKGGNAPPFFMKHDAQRTRPSTRPN